MPEGDRFDKKIKRGWSAAYAGTESGESTPEVAASELVVPLTRDLRRGGGLPGLEDAVRIVTACAGSGGIEDAFSALDRVAMEHSGHRHTVILAQAAKTLLATHETGGTLTEPTFVAAKLIQQTCHDLLDNSFFGVGRYQMIESGRFSSETEARDFERRVHEAIDPKITELTGQLLADATGKSVKTRRSQTPKPTTQDILKQKVNPI